MNYKLISKTDKIYIAGHNGMAGSAIHRSLLRKGYRNILTENKSLLNLENENQVKEWFEEKKPNIVILCAAKVGGIVANLNNPTEFLISNLRIQNNVIEWAWKNNVKRLLFLGSSCIYPKFAKQPIEEEELLNGRLEKTNESYALAKIAGLKLCNSLRTQYGFDAISLMPTNLYGTGDNYNEPNSHVLAALIRKFIKAKFEKEKKVVCWGTGMVYREFLHVDDLGDACCFALEKWDPDSDEAPKTKSGFNLDYLNVGTGDDLTIKDLSNLIKRLVEFDGEIEWDTSKPDGTPKKQLNISRIKAIGWTPKIDLENGLKMTISEYKKNLKLNNYS